jgi:hypothetical protein
MSGIRSGSSILGGNGRIYGLGKVALEIASFGDFSLESEDDNRRYGRAAELVKKYAASDLPLVAPWGDGQWQPFKQLGTLDLIALHSDKNDIVLKSVSQPSKPIQSYRLEPFFTSTYRHMPVDMSLRLYREKAACIAVRVYMTDGKIGSFYGFLTQIGNPCTIACADTVHALLVSAFWPGTEISYNSMSISYPRTSGLIPPPSPQDFLVHGLRLTYQGNPDFGALPEVQSCAYCVRFPSKWRRGFHPRTGTGWCLHGGKQAESLPPQVIESLVGAIGGTALVKLSTSKHQVDKKNKTYCLSGSVSGNIRYPAGPGAVFHKFTFITSTRISPLPTVGLKFMPRGTHPRSAAKTRWETGIHGESCWHSGSEPNPTKDTRVREVTEDTAPSGAAFIKSLGEIPNVHRQGLIPIVAVPDSEIQRAALSLMIADQGGWIYWKNWAQCLGCAVYCAQRLAGGGNIPVLAL